MGFIQEIVRAQYGKEIILEEPPQRVDLTSNWKKLLKANPDRFLIFIQNTSSDSIRIATSQTTTTEEAILLTPQGGTLIISAIDDGELAGLEWYARADVIGNIYFFSLQAR